MGELTYNDFFLKNWSRLRSSSPKQEPSVVGFPDEARPRQTLSVGGIGSGKSKLITAFATYDAFRRVTGTSRRGFALLDNQEDLFRDVSDRLALLALVFNELYDLVYIIDPTNPYWSVKYDPLELMPWEEPVAKADQLAMHFVYLFGDDPRENVRQFRVSSMSFLALILGRKSVLSLPQFVTDRAFREQLVNSVNHPLLTSYWLRQFPQKDSEGMKWIESTMSRVERFLYMNDGISFILEGPSTINLREIMDKGGFLLVNSPIRVLKDEPSSLFLAFIFAALQDAAMSRTDLPLDERTPCTAFLDEYQEYTTPNVRQAFALGRKVRFELFLSTQNVRALAKHDDLRETVRKLAGNILSMRLGREDAEILHRYLFTPELDQLKDYVDGRPVYRSLAEIQEIEIRKLTECPDRMVYWKRMGYPGSRYFRTPTVEDIEKVPCYHRLGEARHQLELAAFRLAGRRKAKRLPAPRLESYPEPKIEVRLWGR